jgi:hypothetical protein
VHGLQFAANHLDHAWTPIPKWNKIPEYPNLSESFQPCWYFAMWKIKATDEYQRRLKRYAKNHPRELAAVLDNLDTYFKTLLSGTKPKQAVFGFVHAEPRDVIAIDQKGGGPSLAQTRLYAYPDLSREVLWLITLGDKRSQGSDIAICKDFVARLPELEGDWDEQEDDPHERLADGARDN